jgi:hypothetical protein
MMRAMQTFSAIVKAWGRDTLAADLGVPKERVRAWERFDTIPDEYWKSILEKAPGRNIPLSPDLLIELAARE